MLEEQGYTVNRGLSGVFQVGNVIQVAEAGSAQNPRQLATPLVFLWGSECFPGRSHAETTFVLPESESVSTGSLSLQGTALSKVVPSLSLDDAVVASHKLHFENVRLQLFAKGDLSLEFSPECVDRLSRALEGGDAIGWFRVVLEAVVADSILFETLWKTESTSDVRAEMREKMSGELAALGSSGGASVKVRADDERKMVLAAEGLVVIAYRSRELDPVLGN